MAGNTARARFKSVLQKNKLEPEDIADFLRGLTAVQTNALVLFGISNFINCFGVTNPKELIQRLDAVENSVEASS
jgi:hypothetical protein